MKLILNNEEREVSSPEELRTNLGAISRTQFSEIWMHASTNWPAICALINGDSAWLMFMRHEGDAGFSTRNPNYAGPPQAVIEYYLSNGQRDEYPASWNITAAEAVRALEYFLEGSAIAPWLHWHEKRP
jgi:hypothetical protein